MKDAISKRWSLPRIWRKRLFWGVLVTGVIALYFVLSLLHGGMNAVLSVAENIIASAVVGITLLLFLEKLFRRNAFFPWKDVSSFLRRKGPSPSEVAKYESDRYKDILGTIIEDHLEKYPQKKVFSFLLMGPEQSGKTCFALYVNGTSGVRQKFLALEVPYAVVVGNPVALDEVFRWFCDGDEGDRLRCRLIVFHAGNSVRQVNELIEKIRVVQERFRKIGNSETGDIGHQIILMVQFTGRRPLEAISSDFKWDDVLDGVFPLNYIAPDWIAKEYCRKREKKGKAIDPDSARQLYLHSLGVPEWYHALADADTEDGLFLARHDYLKRWFPSKDDRDQPPDFLNGILLARCVDTLPFRFLANTFLLEKVYNREPWLSKVWDDFLRDTLPTMDLVNGRVAVKDCGEKFFGPLCEAFLLYHGFLPTVFRWDGDKEERTVREVLEGFLESLDTWAVDPDSNAEYLRRRLLMEFCVALFPYLSMSGARLNDGAANKLRDRLFECAQAVVAESDADYAEKVFALMMGMEGEGTHHTDLKRLSDPSIVKLAEILETDGTEPLDSALAWAPRFHTFVSLCDKLYPDRLPQMAEFFFSYAGHKLYQAFMRSKIGSVPRFHLLGRCIREFRRLACRSQNVLLISKLVELETLRLGFSRPVRYEDVIFIVDDYLTRKYGFFHDSKDFLQCRSWLRKTLCSERLVKGSTILDLSLPEYDNGWQTILHQSELWMANHAVQQVFLLSRCKQRIPWEKVRNILDDLMRRLNWYRCYQKSTDESLPIVFANELLFAQVNFLTYRDELRTDSPDGEWAKLGLDSEMERNVVAFCERGIVEAQRKAWGPMPSDPQERRRADAFCGCRLVNYLLVAFRRNLLNDGKYFVRPSESLVKGLPDSVLFNGTDAKKRVDFIQEVLQVESSLGGGDEAIIRLLQQFLPPETVRGN